LCFFVLPLYLYTTLVEIIVTHVYWKEGRKAWNLLWEKGKLRLAVGKEEKDLLAKVGVARTKKHPSVICYWFAMKANSCPAWQKFQVGKKN